MVRMTDVIIGFLVFCLGSFVDHHINLKKNINDCLNDQVKLYADLCAEEYEEVDSSLAHEQGVKCAVESVKSCLEAK